MSDTFGNLADMLDRKGVPVHGDEARAEVTAWVEREGAVLIEQGMARHEATLAIIERVKGGCRPPAA